VKGVEREPRFTCSHYDGSCHRRHGDRPPYSARPQRVDPASFRSRRVVLHYPGVLEVWVASLLVVAAWRARLTGGGDAKLWIALFWLTPTVMASWSLAVFAGSMLLTVLGQKLHLHLQHIEPKPGPAAWRTLPFVVSVLAYLIFQ
jgi:hypothetical protein